jgi:hypothetical protein
LDANGAKFCAIWGGGGGFVLLARAFGWGNLDAGDRVAVVALSGGLSSVPEFNGRAGLALAPSTVLAGPSNPPYTTQSGPYPPVLLAATPGLFYRYTWSPSNFFWIVTPYSTLNAALGIFEACFSEKFLTNYAIPSGVFILKAPRNNKRILKYGNLELTDDHAVVYNNKPISWEEYLVESNKQYEELPLDEPKYIYNFIGHPDQFHETNKIKIDKNLSVAGGWSTPDLWLERIQKVKIMTNLLENNILPKEHIISNLAEIINKETNDSIYALYIPK